MVSNYYVRNQCRQRDVDKKKAYTRRRETLQRSSYRRNNIITVVIYGEILRRDLWVAAVNKF